MTFPSIDSALEYVKSKLGAFFAQRSELQRRLKQIYDLRQLAEKTNDQASIGRLAALRASTVQLLDDQLRLEDRIRPFAEYFGVMPTLGIIPVGVLAAAVAVASLLYLHFEKLQNQKAALDLVSKGMLSASEADAIVNPGFLKSIMGGAMSMPILLAVLAGAGYLYLTARR